MIKISKKQFSKKWVAVYDFRCNPNKDNEETCKMTTDIKTHKTLEEFEADQYEYCFLTTEYWHNIPIYFYISLNRLQLNVLLRDSLLPSDISKCCTGKLKKQYELSIAANSNERSLNSHIHMVDYKFQSLASTMIKDREKTQQPNSGRSYL